MGIVKRVELRAQGRLLRVSARGLEPDLPFSNKRGDVSTFSAGSRMRLLRLLATIQPVPKNGFRSTTSFLTLTTREFFHPRQSKIFLRTFLKRLYRRYPRLAVVWRMEYQKRGAPHFHLIVYNAPFIDYKWIQEMWGEIVGQERPFTRIELIKSYKHLMSYASKYAAKVDDGGFNRDAYLSAAENVDEYKDATPGRVWGVWHRENLTFAELVETTIPLDGAWWMVRRYCQRFWPWVREESDFGFTVFCDDPYHALKHIVTMSKYFVNEGM